MNQYGYNAPCAAPLSGRMYGLGASRFFGLGVTAAAAQRQATALAKRQAATQARQAKTATRKATAAAKKAVRVAGKTVQTSNPAAAQAIDAQIKAASSQLANVMSLATRAKSTKNKADVQKALVAAQAVGKTIQSLNAPVTPPVAAKAQKLRGMGYIGDITGFRGFGTCTTDANGNEIDNGDGYGCADLGIPATNTGTTGGYVDPTTGLPLSTTTLPISTGLTAGFGLPAMPTFGTPQGYVPRGCSSGSSAPRCLIYSMAQDEQQQFQYVFSVLQQMYAQLLQIVQQLMAQLQSAQQAPYGAYGASPYGASPYTDPYSQYGASPYGDPSQYGYGGQYPGPGGYPGDPYYSGGDSSQIPAGYDDGSGDSSSVPGDASQIFPGPSSSGGGYPMQSYGGPPPGLISSDSLPDGADQQAGSGSDDAAGLIPSTQSGPNLAPMSPAPMAQSTAAPTTAQPQVVQPQIIVLQQGPGQNPYSDAALPAGDKQNQPELDPPEHDDAGLTGFSNWWE